MDDVAKVRARSVIALGMLGEEASKAVPRLISYGGSEVEAILLIDPLDLFTPEMIFFPDLVFEEILRHSIGNKLKAAQITCEALGRIGPNARDAIPFLMNLSRTDDHAVRSAAKRALVQIQNP